MTTLPTSTPAGALAGIRVIDLSRVLAGPLCGQMLGDHGADVIKVEPPAGDETRTWGPPFVENGASAYFTNLNRNKRNIVLDLRTTEAQDVLRQLLADADILIENFKAGTLERWGLSDEYLAAHYPRLIHARITGFGVTGPMGGAPGYDAVLQAYGGIMSINGEPDGPALRVGTPIVDITTANFAFAGILLALQERHTSGRGQVVDCSLLDSAITLLHPHSATWFASGVTPTRTGSAHPTIAPYDTFTAADGDFFIGAANDRQFRDLCAVLGVPDLVGDPRYATNPDRLAHRVELRAALVPVIRDRHRDELCAALLERGVPAGPVNDVAQALTDSQVLHRDMVVALDDGYRGIGIPIKLSRTPGSVRTSPALQGADTEAVLSELQGAPDVH